MDSKEIVIILLIDMSKVFDFLCYFFIIKKLDVYRFGSSLLDLIRFFFDKRFNRVKINDYISE